MQQWRRARAIKSEHNGDDGRVIRYRERACCRSLETEFGQCMWLAVAAFYRGRLTEYRFPQRWRTHGEEPHAYAAIMSWCAAIAVIF